ncbi:MAG: cation transporter, partial [Ekhidna sp.]|uniref:cation transporter n=1 Tax=Ekhidna sp. TaxID=2608089 RepID=UPI0032ECF772
VFAGLMLSFPSYAHIFYSNGGNQTPSVFIEQDTTKTNRIVLDVKGMTCAGCEASIEHKVGLLEGVKSVDAIYATSSTTIEYYPSKVNQSDIIDAINETGYKVIDDQKTSSTITTDNGNVSFYKVPLVCNAAPTIGCGSRAKPVLNDFENSESVDEAWLNRAGTVIAVVWSEPDFMTRRNLINQVFTKHKVNASELLMDGYAENLESFQAKSDWLKGSDVDKLSKEEAGIIADQILVSIKKKSSLSASDEAKLKDKITEKFYDFFLNFESMKDLGNPESYKARLSEIKKFGDDLIGSDNMPTVDELWSACSSAAKSCDHQGCSASCKIPKG